MPWPAASGMESWRAALADDEIRRAALRRYVRKIIGWRALYTEGREFVHCETAWADAPDDGLLVWVLYLNKRRPDGSPERMILDGKKWYFTAPSERGLAYLCNDDPPKINRLRYPGCILKQGKGVDLETLALRNAEAMAAVECPGCGG